METAPLPLVRQRSPDLHWPRKRGCRLILALAAETRGRRLLNALLKCVGISMLTATEVDEIFTCSMKLRAGKSGKLIIIVQGFGGETNSKAIRVRHDPSLLLVALGALDTLLTCRSLV